MKRLAVVFVCLALIGVVLAVSHVGLGEAATALVRGAFGSPTAIMGTLRETTPLLICGAAVFIALQAGLFNIGVEGQLLVGGLTAAAIGLRIHGLGGVVLGVICGALAGSIWALAPALIKAYRGGHEVITTIMLNSVAGFLTTGLVAGPLKDPSQQTPTTASLDDATRMPFISFGDVRLSYGLLLGVIIVGASAWWLRKTISGYELRAVGANPKAAAFAGIKVPRVIVGAMLVSGALAGIAGAVHVLAYEGRFYGDFSPGYGFNSLGVALLAGPEAWLVVPSAFLFGILTKGSASLSLLGLPKGLSNIVLGCLIAVAAVYRFAKARRSTE